MIVKESLLKPLLQAQPELPISCPAVNWDRDFAKGLDTTGGYRATSDGKGVTCIPIRIAHNDKIFHPACEGCKVANTTIIDMKTYREQLGLPS